MPDTLYWIYWMASSQQIVGSVYADDNGRIEPFTYTVPMTVNPGRYEIVARAEEDVPAARVPFAVTE